MLMLDAHLKRAPQADCLREPFLENPRRSRADVMAMLGTVKAPKTLRVLVGMPYLRWGTPPVKKAFPGWGRTLRFFLRRRGLS